MNSTDIDLSVVIPTHGRVDLLKDTLASLEVQTARNFEIIITDDSINETDREAIQCLANNFARKDISVFYIFSRKMLYQAANTNQGLSAARGKYIRILHSDDLLSPTCLSEEVNFFVENPNIDLLYHSALVFTNTIEFPRKFEHLNLCDTVDSWLEGKIFVSTVLPTCLCFRKKLYERTNGMNTSYKFLCDWELFFDFLLDQYENNKQVGYINKCYAAWRVHNSSVTRELIFEHFFEHIKFIKKITRIYEEKNIISVDKLKSNIYNAAVYRYSRLFRDILKENNSAKKLFYILKFVVICATSRFILLHCVLRLLFLPFTIFALFKRIFLDSSGVRIQIEKYFIRFLQ